MIWLVLMLKDGAQDPERLIISSMDLESHADLIL